MRLSAGRADVLQPFLGNGEVQREVRVEAAGFPVGEDGLLVPFRSAEDLPETGMRVGVIRIEANSFPIGGLRLGEPLHVTDDVPKIAIRGGLEGYAKPSRALVATAISEMFRNITTRRIR
jgi:hypothetical protein